MPSDVVITAGMLTALVYTTFAPTPSSPAYSPIYFAASLIRTYVPDWFIQSMWGVVVVVHALEGLYTLSLCRKHRTGLILGVRILIFWLALQVTLIRPFSGSICWCNAPIRFSSFYGYSETSADSSHRQYHEGKISYSAERNVC